MPGRRRAAQLSLAAAALGVGGCVFSGGKEESPRPLPFATPRGKRSDRFPNVELRTQFDRPVRFVEDLVRDRIVLVNFMYTTCTGT
jgi:cytochrome oxidase Cu insertion factor (SCO1/SenC/PrrC family)